MNIWYKRAFVFVIAGIAYGTGIFFSNPGAFGFCTGPQVNSYICRVPGAINIGWSLTALGQVFAIVGIILLLANAVTFRKWFKFSLWYIPIATILTLLMYPTTTPLGGVVPISQGVTLFGYPYVAISLGIVLWSLYTSRKNKS